MNFFFIWSETNYNWYRCDSYLRRVVGSDMTWPSTAGSYREGAICCTNYPSSHARKTDNYISPLCNYELTIRSSSCRLFVTYSCSPSFSLAAPKLLYFNATRHRSMRNIGWTSKKEEKTKKRKSVNAKKERNDTQWEEEEEEEEKERINCRTTWIYSSAICYCSWRESAWIDARDTFWATRHFCSTDNIRILAIWRGKSLSCWKQAERKNNKKEEIPKERERESFSRGTSLS